MELTEAENAQTRPTAQFPVDDDRATRSARHCHGICHDIGEHLVHRRLVESPQLVVYYEVQVAGLPRPHAEPRLGQCTAAQDQTRRPRRLRDRGEYMIDCLPPGGQPAGAVLGLGEVPGR